MPVNVYAEKHKLSMKTYEIAAVIISIVKLNKQLSYRSETALQGGLVFARNRRLELGDSILRTF